MIEVIKSLLIILIIYLAYLFVWFSINLITYFFSVATNKAKPIGLLAGVATIVVYLLDLLLGIGLFWIGIRLLLDGQFLWFILYLFFGAGIISALLSTIQAPFLYIPHYYYNKVEFKLNEEDIETAELLDETGKVIEKVEGEKAISQRLAKYFLAFYALNLINLIIFPAEREGLLALDFITKPLLQIIGGSVIIGIPYGIFHKLKYKSFFPNDKRYFLIQVWKLGLYIYGLLIILVFVLALLTKTI